MLFWDWAKSNFDKLLMSTLFLIMIGVYIHMIHHGADAGSVSWMQTTIGQVLAALFTLVVSKGAQRATDITNTGPGSQTVVTPPPDTVTTIAPKEKTNGK